MSSLPGTVVVGEDLACGLEDPGRIPTQSDLDRVLDQATKVAVRSVDRRETLYETDDPADLRELRAVLRVVETAEAWHCLCLGTVAFVFRRGRKTVGTVTLHHGESVRLEPFFADLALPSPDPVLDWLSDRGVIGPREEYEDERRRLAAGASAAERWHAAMPEALEPLWGAIEDDEGWWPEADELLREEYPDRVERARVLFAWFGHGEGSWSHFPAMELVPEMSLLQLPLDALLAAVRTEPQTVELLEGAARFFAGWDFGTRRPEDLQILPTDVKRLLLAHALASDDEAKRVHAIAAFSE